MAGLPLSSGFDFASVLRPGDHVAWPQGTGEPTGLTARLIAAGRGPAASHPRRSAW